MDQASRTIWANPYDNAPTAIGIFSLSEVLEIAPLPIDLDLASDPDFHKSWDGLLEFRFDWESDGNWDTAFRPAYYWDDVTLDEPGWYTVTMQVRDRYGALATVSETLEIIALDLTETAYVPLLLREYPPPPYCYEALADGGFENQNAWHILVTAYPAAYSTAVVHGGSQAMHLGITDPTTNVNSFSSVRQAVALPPYVTEAQLSIWLYAISGEPALAGTITSDSLEGQGSADLAAPEVGDLQYVLVLDEQAEILEWLLAQREDSRTWRPYTFDISAYAGRTILIQFGVYNDGEGGRTAAYVDDASLSVCYPRDWSLSTSASTPYQDRPHNLWSTMEKLAFSQR
jgi:hypothetical protein